MSHRYQDQRVLDAAIANRHNKGVMRAVRAQKRHEAELRRTLARPRSEVISEVVKGNPNRYARIGNDLIRVDLMLDRVIRNSSNLEDLETPAWRDA